MMAEDSLKFLADQLWKGEIEFESIKFIRNQLEEIEPGLAFIPTFANITILESGEGLILIDSGSAFVAKSNYSDIRNYSKRRLHTVIYTHGHIDHVFGVDIFDEEADKNDWPRCQVIAHENVAKRFDRYKLTVGYNGVINSRQFKNKFVFPTKYRYPDRTYSDELKLNIGGIDLFLFHDKGETDDSTWVWIPQYKTLCTGDLFIWATPNCGNPQKVQRYPIEWAKALRKMDQFGAEYLLPGHGPPIYGANRVRQALRETAEFLEDICKQTLELINKGSSLNDIIHSIKFNKDLLERPFLRPKYDDPVFIIRNLWRLYAGWWDFNPAHLKPAKDADLAEVICQLAGSASKLAEKADQLLQQGKYDLASHLIEWANKQEPKNPRILEIRANIYAARSKQETSLMGSNIFFSIETKSRKALEKLQSKL
jgi:alkyl sulfatase BDS1-like metallo-beta-lactamase superfamily hydrolase